MELSAIQRELLDVEPLRKKIFLLFFILLILACINFLNEFGGFLLTLSLHQFSNSMNVLYIILEDMALPIVFICMPVAGLLLVK